MIDTVEPPVNVALGGLWPLGVLIVKVTLTPDPTGLPPESCTEACSWVAKAVLIDAVCGVPAVADTEDALPTRLVKEKVAEVAPVTEAVTVYAVALAVTLAVTGAEATPSEVVVAVVVTMLAPLAGPVNVTTAPDTRLPTESFTVTTKGLAKAVLIVAL